MYSTGNTVNNTVITLYSDRWLLDFLQDQSAVYINVKHYAVHLELIYTVCQLYLN